MLYTGWKLGPIAKVQQLCLSKIDGISNHARSFKFLPSCSLFWEKLLQFMVDFEVLTISDSIIFRNCKSRKSAPKLERRGIESSSESDVEIAKPVKGKKTMDAACAYGIRHWNTVTWKIHTRSINKNQQQTRKTGNLLHVWPENQHQFGSSTGLVLIQGKARSLFKNFKAEHSTSATIRSHTQIAKVWGLFEFIQHQCEQSAHHMTCNR